MVGTSLPILKAAGQFAISWTERAEDTSAIEV